MLTVGGGVVGGFVGRGAVGKIVGLTLGDFDGLKVGFVKEKQDIYE